MDSVSILYASDRPYDEDLIQLLGSKPELDVVTTPTGAETLATLEETDVDVLLYGRDLPDVAAAELLDRARERDPSLPAIHLAPPDVPASTDADRSRPTATVRTNRADAADRVYDRIVEVVRSLRGSSPRPPGRPDEEILNRITDGFYALDDEWRFTYVNERAADFLKRPAEELVGRSVWEAFPESTDTVLYDRYTRARATGETTEFDIYYEPLEAWFQVTAYPSADGLSVYFVDTTDQMLQAEAMDAADVGILITDPHQPDNPIVYANPGFEALTGYSTTEVLGRNCRFLQGLQTDPGVVARLRRAIDAREPVDAVLINYRENGTPFWNHVQISPVFDSTATLTHFVGFQQDVTARVEEERRAAVLHRVLRHNLRNSMNVILGHATLLEETTALDPEQLAPIFDEGESLLRIAAQAREIDELLERVRVEPTVSTDVERLCSTAVAVALEAHPEATITTNAPEGARVLASDALAVAFEELLENAITHADSAPEVSVTAESGRHRLPDGSERPVVHVSFVDSAPTLPAQERRTLLGSPEPPLQHGSGLGLWLVQWVVTMAGGSIAVAEHPTGGNEITVTLLQEA